MQAPELIPIKVNEALELVGIDLIGEYKQEQASELEKIRLVNFL